MKKIILRYGGYAALAELVFFVATWVIIWATGIGHKAQGYIGWVDLLCPLVFVYLGIRYYRDRVNNGSITFLSALKMGLLIMLIPAVAYGLIETVFVTFIEPDFYKNISKYDLEEYRKTLSPEAFAAKQKELNNNAEMLKNPLVNFCIMALTIAALGTIASVISSVLLKRNVAQKA